MVSVKVQAQEGRRRFGKGSGCKQQEGHFGAGRIVREKEDDFLLNGFAAQRVFVKALDPETDGFRVGWRLALHLALEVLQNFRAPNLLPLGSAGHLAAVVGDEEGRQNVVRHFAFVVVCRCHSTDRDAGSEECQEKDAE